MKGYAVVAEICPEACRFALLNDRGDDLPLLSDYLELNVADLSDVTAAFEQYRAHLRRPLPKLLGLAVSAPVNGDSFSITQSGWTCSQQDLRAAFGFSKIVMVNEAAAAATAIGCGDLPDPAPIGAFAPPPRPLSAGRYALIKLDFGLGVAAIEMGEGGASVIDTEAGHLTFAPQSDLEADLADQLRRIYGRVSYERVLSWPGLSQLHSLLCARDGKGAASLTPLEIVLYGRTGADETCGQALRCFSDILGVFAGDVALALGVDRGVLLSGRYVEEAHESTDWVSFRQRFEAKGRLTPVVSKLPTWALISPGSVLMGAARRLQSDLRPRRAVRRPSPAQRLSEDLAEEMLANVSAGLLVLDADHTILASNQRFWDGSSAPSASRRPGQPVANAFRAMADGGQWSEEAVAEALDCFASGQPYALERHGVGAVLRDEARRCASGRWLITSHDITRSAKRAAELEAITAELRKARTAAETANHTKSAFLATMSHEIRTPLNGVLGMVQAMGFDELSQAQRERVDIIRQSGEGLLAILNDILDLSKIEAGQLELECVEFELRQLLLGAHSAFTALANKKGLSFTLEVAEDADGVYVGDPTRIKQILFNILSNALKFTDTGEVSANAAWTGDALELTVRDSGIGIPADRLSALFERFVQADTTTTRRYGGTGLGLAICRDLAETMGGEIVVESVVGQGSVFRIRLPLDRVEGKTAGRSAEMAPTAPEAPVGPEIAVKVLAAEDNEVNRLVLRTLLHQLNVELTLVNDGQSAVDQWERQPWDIILMDIQMPLMDGVTATRRIREREAETGRAPTPIIALTANAMSHQLADYREAGMDGHVSKPIQAAVLFETILTEFRRPEPDAQAISAAG